MTKEPAPQDVLITTKRGTWPNDMAPSVHLTDWLLPDSYAETTSKNLHAAALVAGISDLIDFAKFTEAFLASTVRFRPDPVGLFDYWQFPGETLVTGEGDCEDLAFLLARLLMYENTATNQVFVVFGRVETKHDIGFHAWVEIEQPHVSPMIFDVPFCLAQGESEPKYLPAMRFNMNVLHLIDASTPSEVIRKSFSRFSFPSWPSSLDPTKAIREKVEKALDNEAFSLAQKWKDEQPAGSDQDFDDCVLMVAAGLAASGAGIGAITGGPIGAGIGAALGAGSGIPAGRIACRRMIG